MLASPLESPPSRVLLRQLFPVSRGQAWISVMSDTQEEVGIIEKLDAFPRETRRMLRSELSYSYFVPVITEVMGLKHEFGFYRWDTQTDSGRRTFHIKGRSEHVRRYGTRILMTDVAGCRYEIPDYTQLPRASQRIVSNIL